MYIKYLCLLVEIAPGRTLIILLTYTITGASSSPLQFLNAAKVAAYFYHYISTRGLHVSICGPRYITDLMVHLLKIMMNAQFSDKYKIVLLVLC